MQHSKAGDESIRLEEAVVEGFTSPAVITAARHSETLFSYTTSDGTFFVQVTQGVPVINGSISGPVYTEGKEIKWPSP